MTFSTLASPGVSLQGGGGSGGGGGGTPGGSNTQIQYNSSGTFAGASGLTTTTGTELTIASGTKTADAPVLNMSQTWNNAGVTFTGLKFNVPTDSSAAGSLLMDLQVGGSSKANITKAGRFYSDVATNATAAVSYALKTGVTTGFGGYYDSPALISAGAERLWANNGGVYLQANLPLALTGTTSSFNLNGAILTRRADNNLRLGAADAAAPVAQTLSVQSGTAGASALSCSISGTTLTVGGAVTGTIAIGHAVTGTGVSAGTVITAGSGTTWTVNNSQTVSSTTMYFNSVGQNLTITGSQGSGPSAGGSIVFQVAPAGSAGTTAQNALVTFLEATSARAFNLYNTTDVTTNYERGFMRWSADTFVIGTDKAGTGQTRNISILPFANLRLGASGSDRLSLGTSNFIPLTNGGVSLGLTANRFSDLFLTGSLNTGAPAGGTAAAWKLGTVASVSPTSPNRTIEVEIGGTTYYIAAKTTND